MKKLINKYKTWKLERIHKWAQWYADLIVKRIEESTTEWELNLWLMKGQDLDYKMINQYNIYLK